jgi:hypothetical protein
MNGELARMSPMMPRPKREPRHWLAFHLDLLEARQLLARLNVPIAVAPSSVGPVSPAASAEPAGEDDDGEPADAPVLAPAREASSPPAPSSAQIDPSKVNQIRARVDLDPADPPGLESAEPYDDFSGSSVSSPVSVIAGVEARVSSDITAAALEDNSDSAHQREPTRNGDVSLGLVVGLIAPASGSTTELLAAPEDRESSVITREPDVSQLDGVTDREDEEAPIGSATMASAVRLAGAGLMLEASRVAGELLPRVVDEVVSGFDELGVLDAGYGPTMGRFAALGAACVAILGGFELARRLQRDVHEKNARRVSSVTYVPGLWPTLSARAR